MDDGYKNLIMFYQTSLRNVGLYTSISFGALGYSRFYRGKSNNYNIGLIFVSIMFVIFASLLNYFLLLDMDKYHAIYLQNSEGDKSDEISKWMIIPQMLMLVEVILLFFGLYTLYNQIIQ